MKTKRRILLIFALGLFSIIIFSGGVEDAMAQSQKKAKAQISNQNDITDDTFLTLKSGKLNMHDPYGVDFKVSRAAFDRLKYKVDRQTDHRIIIAKSGKEANMSEELYQQVVKFVEENNKAIDYHKGLSYGSIRPKTNR